MPYSEIFKLHLTNSRHSGELLDANAIAEETNPVCGDRLRLSLRINDGRVRAARFLAYGCPPTLVCGSVLSAAIEGMPVEAVLRFSKKDLIDRVGGLPSRKQHAAALAIETLRLAIEGACSNVLRNS